MTGHLATVFLSYSHADKPLARALAAGLDSTGCRVWIDEGEIKIGESLFDSIAQALDQVDFVLALMSPASVASDWCQKEISLAMTGEVSRHGVTVLPLRVSGVPVPATLKGKKYLDVDPDAPDDAVQAIADSIRRYLDPPPPLPPRKRAPATGPRPWQPPEPEPAGPIRLVGVDRDAITVPSGDGTRGSALYAVPFRLSATPDRHWAAMFVNNFDRPPSFTSMHRPGIARVSGDRIVLDGTTVDEVVQYHQKTLKLAVDATNAQHAEHQRREQAEQAHRAQALQQHQEEVDRGLARLNFDDPNT